MKRLVAAGLLTIAGLAGAQAQSPALIGGWEVRHSSLGEVYRFSQDGRYVRGIYQIPGPGASPIYRKAERGTFTMTSNTFTLTPEGGQALPPIRWWMGREATGARVLYMSNAQGEQKFFYPE